MNCNNLYIYCVIIVMQMSMSPNTAIADVERTQDGCLEFTTKHGEWEEE